MEKRTGVVIPLASLYTKDCFAVGDFLALKDFADFCSKVGISIIQLLPVNDTGTHSSPYSGLSAFALHPLYIRIQSLPEFEDAFTNDKNFCQAYKSFSKKFKYSRRFNYTEILQEKLTLLHLLYNYIEKKIETEQKKSSGSSKSNKIDLNQNEKNSYSVKFKDDLENFVLKNKWIIPYAVFKNLKDDFMQSSWKEWNSNFRQLKHSEIMLRWNNKALKSSHNFFVWCQLRASEQFLESAKYLRSKNIILKGDIPILMNEDSVDCWANPEFFNQEERAGSPPDAENPLGQNWGFPTYNWERIASDEYNWWKERVKTASNYYDAFRIDHILGFFRIWAVNQNETTAFLGHTIPFESFSLKDLEDLGFDESRVSWLSKPHISTGFIEDITWNHEEATKILESVCTRIKSEELWNFKESIKGDKEIFNLKFCDDEAKDLRIKNALALKWRDRAIIEISKNRFIPVYSRENSTAWKSLKNDEKQKLNDLFYKLGEKENALWKESALSSLTPIVNATKMIPCAEDLGANIPCMSEVLSKLNILSLKVVRWTRNWGDENQPYVLLQDYPELSVATTSVHDSSTLRQWWNDEKQSVKEFIKMTQSDDFFAWETGNFTRETDTFGDKIGTLASDSGNFAGDSNAFAKKIGGSVGKSSSKKIFQAELFEENFGSKSENQTDEKSAKSKSAKASGNSLGETDNFTGTSNASESKTSLKISNQQNQKSDLKSANIIEEKPLVEQNFNPKIANYVLQNCALTRSAWFINPLQDYLYLDQKYYLPNAQDERINIPGSVNDFNWTYRIPCEISELSSNKNLIEKIKAIVDIHNEK